MTRPAPPQDPTLPLPRILCLHGGGVNSTIFRLQLRSFLSHPQISPRFRFVFAEAPFLCEAGAGVHPVYSDYGPFRRWFRWLEEHEEIEAETCREMIEGALRGAMEQDEGWGEWVGVLGFSQGAKLAGSLLYELQLSGGKGGLAEWKFGVVFAGRAPFVALSEEGEGLGWLQSAGGLVEAVDMDSILERPEMRLRVPTVHVHGLRDEGLGLHRRCVEDYCAPGVTWLVEWDGNHRLPLKRSDVDRVVEAVVEVADEYGIGEAPKG